MLFQQLASSLPLALDVMMNLDFLFIRWAIRDLFAIPSRSGEPVSPQL